MKRSALKRRTALRAVSLKRDRHLHSADEPGRAEFKQVWHGKCAACGTEGLVRRHHVVYEQAVRREGGNPWDLRNGMPVGVESTCRCHSRQHTAFERMPLSAVPTSALEFACELLGKFDAVVYLAAHYKGEMND